MWSKLRIKRLKDYKIKVLKDPFKHRVKGFTHKKLYIELLLNYKKNNLHRINKKQNTHNELLRAKNNTNKLKSIYFKSQKTIQFKKLDVI